MEKFNFQVNQPVITVEIFDMLVHYVQHLRNTGINNPEHLKAIDNVNVVLKDYRELTGDPKNITGYVKKG